MKTSKHQKKRSRRSARKPAPRSAAAKAATLSPAIARAALADATRAIKTLLDQSARNYWAIGRRLLHVAELELYKARGYASLVDYAARELRLARASAFQYMRVADAYSEAEVATHGVERLDRGLMYLAATPEQEKPAEVLRMELTVPGRDGEPPAVKPFAEMTAEELRRATQAKRGGATDQRGPRLPKEAVALVVKADRLLDKAVGKALAPVAQVTARKLAGDQIVLDLRGVPLARARPVLATVAKVFER